MALQAALTLPTTLMHLPAAYVRVQAAEIVQERVNGSPGRTRTVTRIVAHVFQNAAHRHADVPLSPAEQRHLASGDVTEAEVRAGRTVPPLERLAYTAPGALFPLDASDAQAHTAAYGYLKTLPEFAAALTV